MTAWLCLAFFLSGAAALLFETLWFHQLGLVLGNTVWASSLVLAGFMGGLCLGNTLAARFGDRISRPVRWYAGLEFGIGASGLGLVYLLPALAPLLAPWLRPLLDETWLLNPLRWTAALALLGIPSTAMGTTLPLLVAGISRSDPRFGRVLGRLYGWNALGAVLGALSGPALLIDWLGIRGSGWVGAAAGGVAAVLALLGARSLDAAAPPASPSPAPPSARGVAILAAAALCGGIVLALEVVWFRFLQLFVLGGSLPFAVMLAVVLAGIGLGGLAAGAWLARDAEPERRLPWLALGSAALVSACYALFDRVAGPFPDGAIYRPAYVLAIGVPLMLPVSLLSGVLFTGLGAALQRLQPARARATGLVTLANTGGAALGALAGGFLLLPGLGIERSLQVLAAGYAGVALVLLGVAPRGRLAVVAAAALVVVAGTGATQGLMQGRYLKHVADRFAAAEGAAPVAVREGLGQTVLLLQKSVYGEPLYQRLVTNAHSMSASDRGSRRYMKAFVYLPVALHPQPRSALLISYGLGLTAKALTETRELETIDVVDPSREILSLDSFVFPDPAERPLADPRVRVHLEDGRFLLQVSDRRWDLITGEPPPPKAAGIVNLFSAEFFGLVRERLAPGGIASYWLPVHSLFAAEAQAVIAAFCSVFDDCSLWSGQGLNWMLLGSRGAGAASEERIARQWRDPRVAAELRELGFERPEQLGALFMADAAQLRARSAEVAPLDDDHPGRIGRAPTDPRRQGRAYRLWMDPERNREAFARSSWVRELWPAPLRERSLDYFRFQPLLDAFEDDGDPAQVLRRLHRVQTTSPLETLAHWQLGHSPGSYRAALAAQRKGRRGPAVHRERAARDLAARDFASAAEGFAAARRAGATRRDTDYLRLYALGMAGRTATLRAAAAETGVDAGRHPDDAAVWRFLVETFALNATP